MHFYFFSGNVSFIYIFSIWPFLNHCECHHLELFLFCLKAHNSVLHGKCIIPIIVFSLVVVVLAVLVCGFDDLLVAIAAKLVYLLFCKKRDFLFFFFVVVQAVARCICNRA